AFRQMVNTRHGFPAGRTALEVDNRGAKLAMHVFLAELTDVPGLAAMLDVVRRLPPPCYSDESWRIVESLLAVLPQVAAQLTLAFRDNGAIDFAHGMLAARGALGRSDEPGELLLRMDFVLEHLLIDEFQDISYTQLDLIRRLTAGWQPGDGRSLFAVGDPMQSIYKFRQAEVRLFVEAQEHGRVGDVPVDCLLFGRHFRAAAALVGWTHRAFRPVLGRLSCLWRGT